MTDFIESIFWAVLIFIVAITIFIVGINIGMKEVASGQYECQLIEQQDKTSEWKCEAVK